MSDVIITQLGSLSAAGQAYPVAAKSGGSHTLTVSLVGSGALSFAGALMGSNDNKNWVNAGSIIAAGTGGASASIQVTVDFAYWALSATSLTGTGVVATGVLATDSLQAPTNIGVGLPLRRNVIFDTDIRSDVDDLAALRMLCWAHKIGAINLMGVAINTTQALAPAMISALLFSEGVVCPISSGPRTALNNGTAAYTAAVTAFPKNISNSAGLPDAVTLYRTLLAAASAPVTIISVGFLNNVQELLQSTADSVSALTGVELVNSKVARLYQQGGDNGGTSDFNLNQNAQAKAAAAYVLANWSGDIYFNDFRSGNFLTYCCGRVQPGTADILTQAYTAFSTDYGRESWDLLTALAAMAPTVAKAGLTYIPVLVTLDQFTGSGSFSPLPFSNRYLAVKSFTDKAYQTAIDKILVPALRPTAWVDVVEPNFGAQVPPATVVDAANLAAWYVASDIAQADASAVVQWQDRLGRYPLSQAVVGAQPAYATAKNGKAAVAFAGGDCLSFNGVTLPTLCTIYVKCQLDAAPGGSAQFLVVNQGITLSTRQVGVSTAANLLASAYVLSKVTYYADVSTGNAIPTGAWTTVTGVAGAADVEAFVNNASSSGGTAHNQMLNHQENGRLTVGALTPDGASESLVGWITEIRIYQGAHTNAQRAAVIAQLA